MITNDQIENVYSLIYCNEPRHDNGLLAVDTARIDVEGYLLDMNFEDSRENVAAVRERLRSVPWLVR